MTGRISKMWPGNPDGKPMNIAVMDDSAHKPVQYHAAFWNERDIEMVKVLKPGDEITFRGPITGISSQYSVIVVSPEQIVSRAHVRKELIAAEDETLPQNVKE